MKMDLQLYWLEIQSKFIGFMGHKNLHWLSDRKFLEIKYYKVFGEVLDWEHPTTYNAKLQWLKLYDRRQEYTMMADKKAVKQYVTEVIGSEYVIPTLGTYKRFEDINFDILPEQFVLKCNHDCGSVVIVKDKSIFNAADTKKKLERALEVNFYWEHREWVYKNIEPYIIVEPYLEDKQTGELRDYKFFCFDGKVKLIMVASDRQNATVETKFDFFDENYQHQDVAYLDPNADVIPARPRNFIKMREMAEKLAKGIPHVRVDFYEANEHVYFGEMTFYSAGGFAPFRSMEFDNKIGGLLHLPKKTDY